MVPGVTIPAIVGNRGFSHPTAAEVRLRRRSRRRLKSACTPCMRYFWRQEHRGEHPRGTGAARGARLRQREGAVTDVHARPEPPATVETIAAHEAGHAVMGWLRGLPCTKVQAGADEGFCAGTGRPWRAEDLVLVTLGVSPLRAATGWLMSSGRIPDGRHRRGASAAHRRAVTAGGSLRNGGTHVPACQMVSGPGGRGWYGPDHLRRLASLGRHSITVRLHFPVAAGNGSHRAESAYPRAPPRRHR
jgi:hypothetical protein